jgi:polysaccharide deacetylase family sporulation protein PdaB
MKFVKKHKKVFLSVALLLIASILTMTISSKGTFAVFSRDKKMPIYCVDTEEKKVAITFDTTWGESNTMELLDILDKYNAKATFFVIGLWADNFPDLVKEIDKRGHEIGNHSNKHPNMTTISKERILKDTEIADAKILDLTGKNTTLFRFPEGAYNDLAIETVESTGRKCIQWDVDSIDWKAQGTDIEYERVMKKAKPGSIILFHTDVKYTPQSLPKILESLSSQGYKFVTVSELMYKDNYTINSEGKQIKSK